MKHATDSFRIFSSLDFIHKIHLNNTGTMRCNLIAQSKMASVSGKLYSIVRGT